MHPTEKKRKIEFVSRKQWLKYRKTNSIFRFLATLSMLVGLHLTLTRFRLHSRRCSTDYQPPPHKIAELATSPMTRIFHSTGHNLSLSRSFVCLSLVVQVPLYHYSSLSQKTIYNLFTFALSSLYYCSIIALLLSIVSLLSLSFISL